MTEVPPGFSAMKTLCDGCRLLREGGNPIVLLPAFPFRSAGRDLQMDLLLHPGAHSGYITRLFFERQVEGRGANWTKHRVVDREWWAPSWKDVPPTVPWPAMLAEHLRAVA